MIEAAIFKRSSERIVKIIDRGKSPIYRFHGRVYTQAPQQAVELPREATEGSDTAWLMRKMSDLNLPPEEREQLLDLAHFSDFNDRSQF